MSKVDRSTLWGNRGIGTVGIVLIVLFLLVVAVGIGTLLGCYTPVAKEIFQPPFEGRTVVRILVLGEDNTGGTESKRWGLADTIILANIDIGNKRLAVLSIPRDTRVDLDGYGGICKINAAHVRGGPTLVALAVERLIGIRPDYYIKVDVEGLEKLVDIVGGVEIDVEKNMRYTDRWGGLYINLKKGPQLLNGEKAMQYVRFRHDALGDIGRIERQQKFLKALAEKTSAPTNLRRLPQIAKAVLETVKTDLGPRDAVYLAEFASRVDLDQVDMAMLPGTPEDIGGINYWIADPHQTARVVQSLLFPRSRALPRVEVLNGSGMSGTAERVGDALRQRGYEITAIGNADSFDYASSEVISHRSGVREINQIASILNSSAIKHEFDASAKADVTVIVGRDCMLADSVN